MRAVAVPVAGAVLELVDLPVPKPGAGEVLVRVHATSINPIDTYLLRGEYRHVELDYPFVPGRDFSGVVAEVGEGVDEWQAGDEVMGYWSKPEYHDGAWAEYDVVPADSMIVHKPEELDDEHAAAMPLAAATALLCVDDVAPEAGDVVLVVGAAGAVGSYAVQLAAMRGAHVIATAKPGHEGRMLALGAAETIDYTQEDVFETVRRRYPDGIPALIDIVSDRPECSRLTGLVRDGGRVSSARYAADRKGLAERGVAGSNVIANERDPAMLRELVRLATSGELTIMLDEVVQLGQVPDAVERFLQGGKGKIVISTR